MTDSKSGKVPGFGLSRLREDGQVQAIDARNVQAVAERTVRELAALDPRVFDAEYIERKRVEIRQQAVRDTGPLLEQMKERAERGRLATEAWSPARRRLAASMADPVAAAALASRLALVSIAELPRLAREAAAQGDWVLADAIHTQIARLDLHSPEGRDMARQVEEALDAMDGESTADVRQHAAEVGRAFVLATIAAGEAAGVPLSPVDRLTLVRGYPDLETTQGAEAVAA